MASRTLVRSHSESSSEPPGDTIDPAEPRSDDSDASTDSFIKGDEEAESESEDDATVAEMCAEVHRLPSEHALTLPPRSADTNRKSNVCVDESKRKGADFARSRHFRGYKRAITRRRIQPRIFHHRMVRFPGKTCCKDLPASSLYAKVKMVHTL